MKILTQNWIKIQNSTLPKFKNSIFQNLGSRKIWNQNIKTWNSISILHFGDRNSKSISKTQKSAPQNLKFDFDFEFLGRKFDFENFKINFSNFSRISFRDPKIRIQRCRKPLNLHFRFKIPIFASNFSSTKILILF